MIHVFIKIVDIYLEVYSGDVVCLSASYPLNEMNFVLSPETDTLEVA